MVIARSSTCTYYIFLYTIKRIMRCIVVHTTSYLPNLPNLLHGHLYYNIVISGACGPGSARPLYPPKHIMVIIYDITHNDIIIVIYNGVRSSFRKIGSTRTPLCVGEAARNRIIFRMGLQISLLKSIICTIFRIFFKVST